MQRLKSLWIAESDEGSKHSNVVSHLLIDAPAVTGDLLHLLTNNLGNTRFFAGHSRR